MKCQILFSRTVRKCYHFFYPAEFVQNGKVDEAQYKYRGSLPYCTDPQAGQGIH